MLISRTYLGVAVLDDCTLYAVGGSDGDFNPLNSVEIFNVSIEKWQMVSSMTIKRVNLGIGVLNNHIYAVGGHDESYELKSAEYYDPTLDTWTRIAEMSVCRNGVGVGVLDSVIYAIGGENEAGTLKSAETYKPSDGVWTSIADMHECRSFPGVVAFNGLLKTIARIGLEVQIDFHGMPDTTDLVNETSDFPEEYRGLLESPNKIKSSFRLRNE
ncbi:unnamed protein product [Macrosiphum euphorbiae]|uniref:Uncharacterized protein n=1 Tax=Macrosiphum euphorbiae TaxID=13131 RepID=A0AAV0W7L7_9HEMI|nr:unnamed protein product [Macrosiphum euphorbiae]